MPEPRLAQPDDLSELLDLYQMLNPGDPDLTEHEVNEQWTKMLSDDSLHIIVVEQHRQLIASCLLSITQNLTRNARPFGVIENVITHDEYRSEGYGKRVIQHATELARDADCYKIMLMTGTTKEWKLEFYETCGFSRDEKTGFVRYLG